MKKTIIYIMATLFLISFVGAITYDEAWECIDEMNNGNMSCSYEQIIKPDESRPIIVEQVTQDCNQLNLTCEGNTSAISSYYEFLTYCTYNYYCIDILVNVTTYPYNKIIYRENPEVLKEVYNTALNNLDNGIDVIENGEESPVLMGKTALFENYITNTTKDRDTMTKVLNFRETLRDLSYIQMTYLILDPDGKLSESILMNTEVSDIGSYNLGAIGHFNRAMIVTLMWENIKQEERLDEIESDLCNQGLTKYC